MEKMKLTINIAVALIITFAMAGCKKYGDDYKSFLNDKETVYPGLVKNIGYKAGNLRTALYWNPSPDPTISKYVVTWNNGASSMEVPATSSDPAELITVVVPNLNEYVYAFHITSYDKNGNKSVGIELNNVRVYGPTYVSTLLNRSYNAANPYEFNQDGSLKLNFNRRDTMNLSTTIRYTNTSGVLENRELAANDNSIVIPNYKLNTPIQYRSSYAPEPGSYDAFNVSQFADFPTIIKITQCDKSLFKVFKLPTDVGDEYGWKMENLWDNNTGANGGDPAGFHTGGSGLPQWFTLDLGQTAQIDNFRLWQRDNALYNVGNPKVFEVWGSNNPNPDGSFDSSWTKLQTFTSVKPSGQPVGQNTDADRAFARAGERFNFPAGTPAVKYLRIKVLETWGGANYIHLLELTFFKSN
jgi:hypothetical protein